MKNENTKRTNSILSTNSHQDINILFIIIKEKFNKHPKINPT